jgi:hypothetical protein
MSVPHGLHSTSLARLVRVKSATRFHALAMRRHDTKRNADSLLPSVHHWLRLLAFPMRTCHAATARPEISRFPNKERACVPGSSTTPSRRSARNDRAPSCCLPQCQRRRQSGQLNYRGSMAGPHVPASTLRRMVSRHTAHDSGTTWFARPSL